MKKLRKGEQALRAVQPNCGIERAYRKKIIRLVDEMAKSYAHWMRAAYRANTPAIAMDATPAAELQRALNRLGAQWQRRFDEGAPELAAFFRKSVFARSDAELMSILKKAGYTVRFKMSPAMRDILQATVNENVSLIKSIPAQFHTQVNGIIMRSVTAGRDLATMTRDLQKQFGVTRRRAEFISLDQNNKATSALQRARQVELGIEDAIWMHSHAGKEPRPTHLANDRNRFKIAEGWYDPDPRVRRRILPGELINCRCTWKPIVKGFS